MTHHRLRSTEGGKARAQPGGGAVHSLLLPPQLLPTGCRARPGRGARGAAHRAADLGDDDLAHVPEVDHVLPRFAAQGQPVGERRPLGAAHAPFSPLGRVPLAGGAGLGPARLGSAQLCSPSAELPPQEGHTAHATREEAVETARQMLDVYADVCRDVLAMPVVKGVKSPTERFAGADDTFTIEAPPPAAAKPPDPPLTHRAHPPPRRLACHPPPRRLACQALMQNGWALQSGTSHFLGQNFAKAFDVTFSDDANQQQHVWATSWGVSTRLVSHTPHTLRPAHPAPRPGPPRCAAPRCATRRHAAPRGAATRAVRAREPRKRLPPPPRLTHTHTHTHTPAPPSGRLAPSS